MIFFFIKHEGGNSPTGIGVIAGLAMDTDSGMASAILILSAGDSAREEEGINGE